MCQEVDGKIYKVLKIKEKIVRKKNQQEEAFALGNGVVLRLLQYEMGAKQTTPPSPLLEKDCV